MVSNARTSIKGDKKQAINPAGLEHCYIQFCAVIDPEDT